MSQSDPILTQVWLPGRGFVTYPAPIGQRTPEQLADAIVAALEAIDAADGITSEPVDRAEILARLRRADGANA